MRCKLGILRKKVRIVRYELRILIKSEIKIKNRIEKCKILRKKSQNWDINWLKSCNYHFYSVTGTRFHTLGCTSQYWRICDLSLFQFYYKFKDINLVCCFIEISEVDPVMSPVFISLLVSSLTFVVATCAILIVAKVYCKRVSKPTELERESRTCE